jgi:DNA-binding transcriptional LysR family regulator
VRVGINNVYVRKFIDDIPKLEWGNIAVYADHSNELAKSLLDGFIDVAIYFALQDVDVDPSVKIVGERPDEMTWVRSADFTLSPGAPIPLITWPGQTTHDLMIQALEQNSMVYRIAFSSPDFNSRMEAAKAGWGLTILPKRAVSAPLQAANEYYLPALRTPKLLLCAHAGVYAKHRALVDKLHVQFMGL